MRKQHRIAALALCAVLLAACGTDAPAPRPTISSVEPVAGPPGTKVTVEGNGFGTSGVLLLGDMVVTADEWASQSVTFTVPQGSAPAWQDLLVRPTSGDEAAARFFVGHPFTGSASELQGALDDLGEGAHVLLPPGELALPGQELVIDLVHLYGHPEGTELSLDPGGGVLVATGGNGTAGLADVTVEGAYVALRPVGLKVAQDATTQVTFERLAFTGATFGTEAGSPGGLGRVALLDSRVVVTGGAELAPLEELVVRGTHLAAHEVNLNAVDGEAAIEGSTVVGFGLVYVSALARLSVVGSTLRAESGDVTLWATGRQLPEPPVFGRLEVRTSVVEALAKPPVNGTLELAGVARLAAWGTSLELVENERIAASERVEVELEGAADEGALLALRDNVDIAAGRFAEDGTANRRARVAVRLDGGGSAAARLEMTGNHVRSARDFIVDASSPTGSLEVSGNVVEPGLAHDDAAAEIYLTTDGAATLSDNVIGGGAGLQVQLEPYSDGETGPGIITGNRLTAVTGHEQDIRLISEKPCQVTDNVAVAGDPSDPLSGFATVECSTERHPGSDATIARNDITAYGDGVRLILYDLDEVVVEQNSFAAPDGYLDVDASDVNLVFRDNEVTANIPLLALWTEETVTVTNNEFLLTGDDPRGLEFRQPATLTVTDNTFTVAGEPANRGVAIEGTVRYQTEVDVRGNTFTGFGAAVLMEVSGGELTGAITDNHFDFPMSSPGQGGHFIVTGSTVQLDMTMNRWGDITDEGEARSLFLIERDDESFVSIAVNPIRTD